MSGTSTSKQLCVAILCRPGSVNDNKRLTVIEYGSLRVMGPMGPERNRGQAVVLHIRNQGVTTTEITSNMGSTAKELEDCGDHHQNIAGVGTK